MRFTLPALALLASTVLATPTGQSSIAELTDLAASLDAGADVPEGVLVLDKRAAAEDVVNTLMEESLCALLFAESLLDAPTKQNIEGF
ncbi:hypothetical protein AJ80_08914 [Polytolypa hystricis UAMH7299]|uniref:Uncharacterized protein n=1 Tax=Polytolypa hystricis (strain UAMH7299) TaxID=1447883 RepID=A0A2B7X098_POLH7|nr:hypothetical protein AJ80_08914 [Polytolypa hystricis UAMH7299]